MSEYDTRWQDAQSWNDDSQWSSPPYTVIEGRTEEDIIDSLQRQARLVKYGLICLFLALLVVGLWFTGPN